MGLNKFEKQNKNHENVAQVLTAPSIILLSMDNQKKDS